MKIMKIIIEIMPWQLAKKGFYILFNFVSDFISFSFIF